MSIEGKLAAWRTERARLVGLAYRMLGEVGRAEDFVQEAWIRFSESSDEVLDARAYLVTIVTRLCITELQSARVRREEKSGTRLPEPVDPRGPPFEDLDQVSTAFLVMLQRLSPAERAVLLLHEVFEYDHGEIALITGRSAAASRKLLERARSNVAEERRMLEASREEHRRLLEAFVGVVTRNDVAGMIALLTEDAALIGDGAGAGAALLGVRELKAPRMGRERIAAFLCATARKSASLLTFEICELNGQPSLVFRHAAGLFAVLSLGVEDGRIRRVFFQANRARVERLERELVRPPRAPTTH